MAIGIIGGMGRMGRKLQLTLEQNFQQTLICTRRKLEDPPKNLAADVEELVYNCDTIILSVKPTDMPEVCNRIADFVYDTDKLEQKKLIISVAAGIPDFWYYKWFAPDKFIRLMPNYFLPNKTSIMGIQCTEKAYHLHRNRVSHLFSPGYLYRCSNTSDMDRITAAAACAPAIYARIYHSLLDAHRELGFKEEEAKKILWHTMISVMNDEAVNDPYTIMNEVASPGGATHKGLRVLEETKMDDIVNSVFFETYDHCRQIRDRVREDFSPKKDDPTH